MLVYFVFLAAVGLWSILYARFKSNPGFSKTLYALMCIALTCLMGFRSTVVGVDTYAYSTYFTKIAQSNDPGYYMNVVSSAPVYSAYNKLVGIVSDDPQVLIFVTSFIICVGTLYFIRTFSANEPLSIFLFVALYFYLDCFNGMRQGLAMALLLAAFTMVYLKKRKVLASLLVICAIGTHATTLLMVPFLFLPLMRMNRKGFRAAIAAVVFVAIAVAAFSQDLVLLFVEMFDYAQYANMLSSTAYATTGKNALRTLFYGAILILGMVLVLKAKEDPEVRRDRLVMIPALFGVCLGLAFYDNYLIGARIAGYYFMVFMIVVIPNCANYLKWSRMLYLMTACTASAVLFVFLLNGNYSGVVPYEAFWSA